MNGICVTYVTCLRCHHQENLKGTGLDVARYRVSLDIWQGCSKVTLKRGLVIPAAEVFLHRTKQLTFSVNQAMSKLTNKILHFNSFSLENLREWYEALKN